MILTVMLRVVPSNQEVNAIKENSWSITFDFGMEKEDFLWEETVDS
jgi:hypothetical protein